LLIGAVIAQHLDGVSDDYIPDIHHLLNEVEAGQRVVQPRLRHRFQIDRHGLSHSSHRLIGDGDDISFDFATTGTDLAQVLGAIYAVERLAPEHRRLIAPVMQKAARWRGPIGATMIAYFAGSQTTTLEALADPGGWAMQQKMRSPRRSARRCVTSTQTTVVKKLMLRRQCLTLLRPAGS
jgi:ribosomal protein S14